MKNGCKHAKWNWREEIWAGVAPCECHFERKWRNWQRLKIEYQKIRQKTSFSPTLFIQFRHPTPLHTRQTPLVNIAVLCGSAPSHPQKVIGPKMSKNGKDINFGTKNRQFGQQKMFQSKNVSRDFFLYHHLVAVCKI